MNNPTKGGIGWRISRWVLVGIALLVTLVAVLVTEENWRGKRAWANYQRAAVARGERFDWSAFGATNVPDDQNFLKAPIFTAVMAAEPSELDQNRKPNATNTVDRLRMSSSRSDNSYPEGTGGDWSQARLTNLKVWQDYYRSRTTNTTPEFPIAPEPQSPAADVLLALSRYDSAIEELREASHRPFSAFGQHGLHSSPEAMSRILAYLSELKGCTQVLSLRAIAELADNQTAKALDDVKLLLRLHDSLRQEPLLIEHLVGLAIAHITLQPIYEGLAQHRWNDTQLAELQNTLAAKDFLADHRHAMKGERTFAIQSIEARRITREQKEVVVDGGTNKVVTISFRFMPSAYFYQTELAIAQLCDQFVLPLVDVTNRVVSPTAERESAAAVRDWAKHSWPYRVEAGMMFPAISKSVMKSATLQAEVDLATVACGLERYRLAHGAYPDRLEALAPQFVGKLPHDVIGGQPLHYRTTDAGKFVLYSIGWDEKDDGGATAQTKSGRNDLTRGDLVWRN